MSNKVYPQFVVVSSRELRNLHVKIRAISRTISFSNEDLRDRHWGFLEHGGWQSRFLIIMCMFPMCVHLSLVFVTDYTQAGR